MQSIPNPQANGHDRRHPDAARLPLYRLLSLAERLPSPERVVLTWFLRHDPPQPLTGRRKGVAWGKVRQIAADLKTSERTVQNGSSGLVARGILSRDPENQLQYRIHYAALLRATSRETVCEGCGRPLKRERGTKRYHDSACRMRALRRRRRLERERSRRAAAFDALLPSVIQITLPGAQNGAPEGNRTNGHGSGGGISTKAAAGNGDCRPSSPQAGENGVAGAGKSSRDGECDANLHPPAPPSVASTEKAQEQLRNGHGAAKRRIAATVAKCDANLHPGVTLTCTPYQNVKTSKTYNDLNVDRLESESNVDHPGDAAGHGRRRSNGKGVQLNVHPKHAELQRLLSSSIQIQRLIRAYGCDLVVRAIRVADLEYSSIKTPIRNPFGLIYAMCRDLDDTKLIEHEERLRRERERCERQRRLRELQARGCKRCGWWQVGWDGYCEECRPALMSYSTGHTCDAATAVVR